MLYDILLHEARNEPDQLDNAGDDIPWIQSLTKLPLIIKGIQCIEVHPRSCPFMDKRLTFMVRTPKGLSSMVRKASYSQTMEDGRSICELLQDLLQFTTETNPHGVVVLRRR